MTGKRWWLLGGGLLVIGLCVLCAMGGFAGWLWASGTRTTTVPSPTRVEPGPTLPSVPPSPSSGTPPRPSPSPTTVPRGTLLLASERGLWKATAQGLVSIASLPVHRDLLREVSFKRPHLVSPSGEYVALLTLEEEDVALVLVHPSSGGTQTVARVAEARHLAHPRDLDAVVSLGNLAWHPQEDVLAFVALSGEGASGLYLYDLQAQRVETVDASSGFVLLPQWSPDGRRLAYVQARWPTPAGGRELNAEEGEITQVLVWDRVTGERRMLSLPAEPPLRLFHVLGWGDATTLLFNTPMTSGCSGAMLGLNVETGALRTFDELVFSSVYRLGDAFFLSSTEECGLGAGIFLWRPGETPRYLVAGRAWGWIPLPMGQGVLVYNVSSSEVVATREGEVFPAPDRTRDFGLADVSPQGHQAWYDFSDADSRRVWVLRGGRDDPSPVLLPVEPLAFLGWEVAVGDTLYLVTETGQVLVASEPGFVPAVLGDVGKFLAGLGMP